MCWIERKIKFQILPVFIFQVMVIFWSFWWRHQFFLLFFLFYSAHSALSIKTGIKTQRKWRRDLNILSWDKANVLTIFRLFLGTHWTQFRFVVWNQKENRQYGHILGLLFGSKRISICLRVNRNLFWISLIQTKFGL